MMNRLLAAPLNRPRITLLFALAITGLAFWLTATHLKLDTDPARMLDPELPFVTAQREYSEAFPMFRKLLVVVVEAESAARAEDAALAFAADMSPHADDINYLVHAGHEAWFARQGLLYLSIDALWDMDQRLAAAAPFLGSVAADPSLRGLFATLSQGLSNSIDDAAANQLASLLQRITTSAEAELNGSSPLVLWRDELVVRPGSSDGPAREFLLIQPKLDYSRINAAGALLGHARAIQHRIEAGFPGVRIGLTGPVALDDEELGSVSKSAGLTTTLSLSLVLAILIVGLRSGVLIAAVLVNLVLGLIWTTAFAALTVGSLNLITVNFAVLFIGMGVDFGIQYALRYREALQTEVDRALLRTGQDILPALSLAALAAIIAFLSFTPTSYRGLAELGLIASGGMGIALLTTLLVLPALFALLPRPRPRPLPSIAAANPSAHPGTYSAICTRIPQSIVVSAIALGLASIWLSQNLSFDFNPLNLKDPNAPSVATYRSLLADMNATPYTAQLLVPDATTVADMRQRLLATGVVSKVLSLDSFVATDQDDKLAIIDGIRLSLEPALLANPAAAPSATDNLEALNQFIKTLAQLGPETPGALQDAANVAKASLSRLAQVASQTPERLASFEQGLLSDLLRVLQRLQDLLDASAFAMEDLPNDLASRYVASDGRQRLEIYPKANLADNNALAEFVTRLRAIDPKLTGSPVGIYAGGEAVIAATQTATLLALLASAVLFWLVLKTLADSLMVSVPLIFGLLTLIGSSVMLNAPFNLANIIALPLLIGLNNAYGVYVVLRYRELGIVGLLGSDTPRAVLLSGLTTAASFATLAAASHPGMASMGLFVGLAIVWSLVFALLALPAMLALRGGVGHAHR